MKASSVIWILQFLLFFPSLSLGQVGRLRGTVTDAEGNPVKDCLIEISGMDIKRNYKVKTNKDGKYLHVGIYLLGVYRLVARAEGYEPSFIEGARPTNDPANEKSGRYDFTLRKGDAERQLAFELSDEEREALAAQRAAQEKKAAKSKALKQNFDSAVKSFDEGNYEEAIELLNKAAEADSTQSAVWTKLAQSYEKLDRSDEALSAYERASALQPSAAVYQNMGNIYAAKQELEKAQTYYDKAVELSLATDPSLAASTYYNIAVNHINSGQNEAAIDALQKSIAADPGYAESYYQLGITLLGTGQMEDAVRNLKKYIELAPTGANAETAKALVEQLGG